MNEQTCKLESRGWIPTAKGVYKDEKVKTYVCARCGTDKFIVGCGDCQTIIKCPNCGWEEVIHDG